jgi:uncharacterized protein GlcG (DUF336 family)
MFVGGIPLMRGGKVMGVVGMRSSSEEQDRAVVEARAKAF